MIIPRRVFALLSVVWCIVWGYQAYIHIAPAVPRKVVTLTLQQLGTARFVFSAAQPENEILYEMRAILAPQMTASPERFVGLRYEQPYADFLRARVLQVWWCALLGVAPLLLGAVSRTRLRRLWRTATLPGA